MEGQNAESKLLSEKEGHVVGKGDEQSTVLASIGIRRSSEVIELWLKEYDQGSKHVKSGTLPDNQEWQNDTLAGLGIRTYADIYNAAQNDFQNGKASGRSQPSGSRELKSEKESVNRPSRQSGKGRPRQGNRNRCQVAQSTMRLKKHRTAEVGEEKNEDNPKSGRSKGLSKLKDLRPASASAKGGEWHGEVASSRTMSGFDGTSLREMGIRTSEEVFSAKLEDRPRVGQKRKCLHGAPGKGRLVEEKQDTGFNGEPRLKHARMNINLVHDTSDVDEELAGVLGCLENEFAEKERLSRERSWCKAIPLEQKLSTVREFYDAFHDHNTMPTHTCPICYCKFGKVDLQVVSWGERALSQTASNLHPLWSCEVCFPPGRNILGCSECVRNLRKGVLSPAGQVHSQLGCEHRFPDELKGLTPIEEKLIALNSCYGFITKVSISDREKLSANYARHVKGHITVFPNNVQELTTKVLPHPLLKVLDDIYVSWEGREKPGPKDMSKLLSVRRRVVEKALRWLQANNHLYADITINGAEMDSWDIQGQEVPRLVYERLERNERSAKEKIHSAHVVPPSERGLSGGMPVDIQEVLASLRGDVEMRDQEDDGPSDGSLGDAEQDVGRGVQDISASGMVNVDCQPSISDSEKLRYLCEAIGGRSVRWARGGMDGSGCSAEVCEDSHSSPYILVSKGEEFANSLDPWFFAKTFPTLLPYGTGGPQLAQESAAGNGNVGKAGSTQDLMASRNMSLGSWAELTLRRQGGRFAMHLVFAFLVFNIGVRCRNRRASMASLSRRDFAEVEKMVHSLTTEKLETAQKELQVCGRTSDKEVNQLLRSLALYGYRQPMSRESRLTTRRKAKSLMVWCGIPAIWITLNPNDITNPVKLRLAVYRTSEAAEAESVLRNLDDMYQTLRLAISDPVSSAIFFHREVSMFFKYYVRVGTNSVFGRISQYLGVVETNERGSLHFHGLLWLHGNLQLSSLLQEIGNTREVEYRNCVLQFLDSIFSEDLDEAAFAAARPKRSLSADMLGVFQDRGRFAAAFEDEANFCAGASQVHTHSPTCLKYSFKRRNGNRNLCRFGAPWKLIENTKITEDGLLQVKRNHNLVNRWNEAMAVGLRHNHDISFILTKCKSLALVFYVTNYATKVEDPVWKRIVAAKDVAQLLRSRESVDQGGAVVGSSQQAARENRARQFLLRVANRVFTDRALSHVEVVAHLLGYGTEFTNNAAWTFLNLCSLYWRIFRRWRLLQETAEKELLDEQREESVAIDAAGQKISLLDSYFYRGRILKDIALCDYLSIVKLKRKQTRISPKREIELDRSWPYAKTWVQVLRPAGQHAAVCLDGYLSMDFSEEDDNYHKRAAVQHLAMFVPWQNFLVERNGDINDIWIKHKEILPKRIFFYANNIQLLRRSAEDVRRDAKQWAAECEGGPFCEPEDPSTGCQEDGHHMAPYQNDDSGVLVRFIDVLRKAVGTREVTAGSGEISWMLERLFCFQADGLASSTDLSVSRVDDGAVPMTLRSGEIEPKFTVPRQQHLRSIKSQQIGLSREREMRIQGIQSQCDDYEVGHQVATSQSNSACQPTRGLPIQSKQSSTMDVRFGPAGSFSTVGEALTVSFTLNRKQNMALRLICRQLDRLRETSDGVPQLCMFVGGEGGTGKSRLIAAIKTLFRYKEQPHRLLVTATSGTAAANIEGITIHSACKFSKESAPRSRRLGPTDQLNLSGPSSLRIDGRTKMDWQEKRMIVVDEISMLGARTLYAVNEQLCRLRESAEDFGGIPVVLFCGDFHQFRPVRERSILLPSTAVRWDERKCYLSEHRRQHDRAHALWKRFKTVVILDEQVRAASDARLRRLLSRIRQGAQDQSDLDLLNTSCYREGRRIPWESGITVVTPLNRNRWNLNIEAAISFQKQKRALMRVFISEHRWTDGEPSEEEALMILNYGDDSGIPIPAIFMFVPGMPVTINHNIHQGLKLVNGAGYTACEIIVDKTFPGYRISEDMVIHFGPPAGIILASDTTKDFRFVGLPPGTMLLTPMSMRIERGRKRPWQTLDATRRGLACASAFACTDYKVQGRTLGKVALELRGARTVKFNGEAVPSQCDPYSLYVQLSRCTSLDGIMLLSKVREKDFLGNEVPGDMLMAEKRLEALDEATVRDAESWSWRDIC